MFLLWGIVDDNTETVVDCDSSGRYCWRRISGFMKYDHDSWPL